MTILGLSCYYHDSSACLIKDGRLVAAGAEERFSRIKHDNDFPYKAIEFCLDSVGIAINEIDAIAFYEKPIRKFDRVLHQHLEYFPKSFRSFIDTIPSWLQQKTNIRSTLRNELDYHGPVYFVEHHLSHAAASYFSSPFKKAAILTLDGVGEWATTTKGFAQNNDIILTDEIRFPHSLGLLYSTITAFLGFKVNNDEYKVMGLSAYGDPKPYRSKLEKLIHVYKDGSFKLNMQYFSYGYKQKMFSDKLVELLGKPRKKEGPMPKRYKNIAASLQELLEQTVFTILTILYKEHTTKNLILSGGVALNSLMNGKIITNTPFNKIFITPDPGDGGGALGAALYVHVQKTKKRATINNYAYLGPSYDWAQIREVLDTTKGISYKLYKNFDTLVDKSANLLKKDKVIGWFQGRMEWGPRALGNRSILAQTTTQEMQDLINAKIKHREMFRPFAPVILRDKVKEWFEVNGEVPIPADFMLMVYPFKKQKQKKVPAVVHVDGTGRLQTIDRKANTRYYDVINAYYKKTKIPILLNTSFNVRGEPIVCTPQDAIRCFLKTDIDYLVIDNYLVEKRS